VPSVYVFLSYVGREGEGKRKGRGREGGGKRRGREGKGKSESKWAVDGWTEEWRKEWSERERVSEDGVEGWMQTKRAKEEEEEEEEGEQGGELE